MELKERLINNNIAIHCDTFEKAEYLFEILDRWDVVWSNYRGLYYQKDLNWNNYEDKTCYSLRGCLKDKLSYTGIEWCQSEYYDIWTFEKFIEEYIFDKYGKSNAFTRNWNVDWNTNWINKENMEEEIMRKNIKVENNKTILTFLTDGLTKDNLKISYFKKYEDEHKVDLKVKVTKGNQFVEKGFEQIITIDRIKIPKNLSAKYNNGIATIEFDNIDENIEIKFED